MLFDKIPPVLGRNTDVKIEIFIISNVFRERSSTKMDAVAKSKYDLYCHLSFFVFIIYQTLLPRA